MVRPALLALPTLSLLLLPLLACPTTQPEPDIEDPPYDTNEEIIRLAVSPTHVNFGNGDRQELSAALEYADGDEVDVTDQVHWIVVDEAVASVDGVDAVGEGVGWTQIYATLDRWTSNVVTVEVGHFSYAINCDNLSQGNVTLCTVTVDGRELDVAHPDYITFAIEGFVPFGHDRATVGLDATDYFWIEDEQTFKARFLIPTSLPLGAHAVDFRVEGVPGEGDPSVSVTAHNLTQKVCDPEVETYANLQAFDERKYWVDFSQSSRAYDIYTEKGNNSQIDTALWLFDDEGNLFTFTDTPRGGGTDAALPLGITEELAGDYYLVLTASPHAATADEEHGFFELYCDEEAVAGNEIQGDQEQNIPHGGQTASFDLQVDLGPQHLIDGAWVHVDLETDVPSQVAITLDSPEVSVGLRSTGYDADHLAVTWGALVTPDQYSMSDFVGTSPNGTWTLSVTDYSSNGATTMHNWELYLDSSPK